MGSKLRLYRDDHLVKTVKDSTSSLGAVGVVVGSYTNHRANKDVVTVARYTDSEIWLLIQVLSMPVRHDIIAACDAE